MDSSMATPPFLRRIQMLVLSRKKNESIVINDDITIVVVEIRGDKVRLGIEAPKEVPVHRREVFDAIHRNEAATGKGKEPDKASPQGTSPDWKQFPTFGKPMAGNAHVHLPACFYFVYIFEYNKKQNNPSPILPINLCCFKDRRSHFAIIYNYVL